MINTPFVFHVSKIYKDKWKEFNLKKKQIFCRQYESGNKKYYEVGNILNRTQTTGSKHSGRIEASETLILKHIVITKWFDNVIKEEIIIGVEKTHICIQYRREKKTDRDTLLKRLNVAADVKREGYKKTRNGSKFM